MKILGKSVKFDGTAVCGGHVRVKFEMIGAGVVVTTAVVESAVVAMTVVESVVGVSVVATVVESIVVVPVVATVVESIVVVVVVVVGAFDVLVLVIAIVVISSSCSVVIVVVVDTSVSITPPVRFTKTTGTIIAGIITAKIQQQYHSQANPGRTFRRRLLLSVRIILLLFKNVLFQTHLTV